MRKILTDIRESIVSIAIGMGITFKHLGKKPVTQHYPDERWSLPGLITPFSFAQRSCGSDSPSAASEPICRNSRRVWPDPHRSARSRGDSARKSNIVCCGSS